MSSAQHEQGRQVFEIDWPHGAFGASFVGWENSVRGILSTLLAGDWLLTLVRVF
jgi:hypothetical protein